MSYGLYDGSITQALSAVNSLHACLKKAEAQPNSASFIDARIAPDMLPLSFQVTMVTKTSIQLASRAEGKEPEYVAADLKSFADYYAEIEKAKSALQKADESTVNSKAAFTQTIPLGPKNQADLTGIGYVNGYALPNIYFHLSIAYAILRKEGVDLGKMDFLVPFLGQYLPAGYLSGVKQ